MQVCCYAAFDTNRLWNEETKRATCLDNIHHVKNCRSAAAVCVYGLETSYYCIYMTNRSVVCVTMCIANWLLSERHHWSHDTKLIRTIDGCQTTRLLSGGIIMTDSLNISTRWSLPVLAELSVTFVWHFLSSLWYFHDYLFFCFRKSRL